MRTLLYLALIACDNKTAPPPTPSEPPRDASVIDAEDPRRAQLQKERAEIQREIDEFDRQIDDPANRAPGWTKVAVLTERVPRLWGIYAVDDDVIAVGNSARIVRSIDAGATWKQVDAGPVATELDSSKLPPTLQLVTGNGDDRYTVGFQNNAFAVSFDRGATWTRPTLDDPDLSLTGVFASKDTVYVSGKTALYTSRDRGKTFTRTPDAVPSTAEIRGLVGDGSTVYLYGSDRDRPMLRASSDRGRTWRSIALGTDFAKYATVGELAIGPDHTLYLHPLSADTPEGGPRDNRLATSRSGGASWSFLTVPFAGPADEIDTVDKWWSPGPFWLAPDGAIYAGVRGRATTGLQVSRDRGKTWTHELAFEPRQMAFTKSAIYVVGRYGEVWIKKR
jgi:hypothetical protein